MDLTIEIGGDIRTLEEALDKFTCTEILDGENKYNCSRWVLTFLLSSLCWIRFFFPSSLYIHNLMLHYTI